MKSKALVTGAVILLFFFVILAFGPSIAPFGPDDQNLFDVLRSPSFDHWFGTDALGRDILSRTIFGARYSLLIALLSTVITALIGIPVGVIAGYCGRRTDDLIMRVVDLLLTFPGLISAILAVSILGPGIRSLVIAIVISFSPRVARVSRGAILEIREREFILAARALGASAVRVMALHALPNAAAPILVEVTLRAGQAVLLTASLGFLGLGVRPPIPEWGTLISAGRDYLSVAPYMLIGPGLAISLAILSFNLLGDGLRDLLDPRLRGWQ